MKSVAYEAASNWGRQFLTYIEHEQSFIFLYYHIHIIIGNGFSILSSISDPKIKEGRKGHLCCAYEQAL